MTGFAFTPDAPARVAVLISGRGSNMARLLESCQMPGSCAQVQLVLSDNAEAPGLDFAASKGVATVVADQKTKPEREAAIDAALRDAEIDIVCLAGFMRVLSAGFTERWRDRILNVHPSLLPSFRGLETHARALEAGVRLHGATVHLVRPALDDGPILAQGALEVGSEDDADSLAARVLTIEHRLYPAVLMAYASGRVRVDGEKVIGGPEEPNQELLSIA